MKLQRFSHGRRIHDDDVYKAKLREAVDRRGSLLPRRGGPTDKLPVMVGGFPLPE